MVFPSLQESFNDFLRIGFVVPDGYNPTSRRIYALLRARSVTTGDDQNGIEVRIVQRNPLDGVFGSSANPIEKLNAVKSWVAATAVL